MVLLSALRRSRTRRRTGQPTRCVRTMPPRSPDAARVAAEPGPVRALRELNDHRTGARRRCRSMAVRASLLSWRGDFRRRCRERALPSSIALGEHPEDSELARRPRPHRASRSSRVRHPRSVPHRCVDRSAEPVPNRGGGAVVCVRYRAFEVSAAQRRPRRRSMSDASSSSLSSRRSRRIVPASSRAWQRSFHS
jgi:hypothetical protein